MQNTNTYVGNEQRGEIPNEGGAAQQLEQVLASGLPPLCRRACRILGNAAAAEDAVQDALLAAHRYVKKVTSRRSQHFQQIRHPHAHDLGRTL